MLLGYGPLVSIKILSPDTVDLTFVNFDTFFALAFDSTIYATNTY